MQFKPTSYVNDQLVRFNHNRFAVFSHSPGDIWFATIDAMLTFLLKLYERKTTSLLLFSEWFFMEIYSSLASKFYCRGFYVYLDTYTHYVNLNYNKRLYNGFFFQMKRVVANHTCYRTIRLQKSSLDNKTIWSFLPNCVELRSWWVIKTNGLWNG